MNGNNNSRRRAAFAVAAWLSSHDFPQNMLPEGPDRAFVQDLVYTVIRRLRALRRVLGELVARWPKGELEALLYVGAAQILYMESVPDFAAVNETVEAAKVSGNPSIARVVNGVLRNLIRRKEAFQSQLAAAPLEERESFPTALVRRWTARFGAAGAEKLCVWHNTPAETYIARRDGSFTVLERGEKVTSVAGYAEGAFIVQDPGTRRAIDLVAPHPGLKVLDACAAPGGKTVQLAWRGADVTACEVNPRRRARLVENLKRLHLDLPVLPDIPPSPSPSPSPLYDVVLVDAPCSNTGVLRRRPDARWNWSAEKLAELVRLQAAILDRVVPLVAPGGAIVYSTCSNEPEENEDQVAAFLARHADFVLAEQGESVPFESGTDGAFAAKLVKGK